MDDIVERLRGGKCPECNGWGEVAYMGDMVGCTCLGKYEASVSMKDRTEAADTIESLRAENARLTEERDALVEAVVAAIECGMVPKSSAREGGAVKHTRAAQVADMLRDAIAKVKGGPDAR